MQPVKLLMQQCKSTSLHVHVATMSLHFNHQFKSLMYVLITMKFTIFTICDFIKFSQRFCVM